MSRELEQRFEEIGSPERRGRVVGIEGGIEEVARLRLGRRRDRRVTGVSDNFFLGKG